MSEQDLGKLQSIHGIAPAFLQRAAIVVIVSFSFFLLMMVAFSIRQNIGYFLLATAFLVLQLITLYSWVTQKKVELKLFENGFTYKKHVCAWDDIDSIALQQANASATRGKIGCEIKKSNGEKIVLNETIQGVDSIIKRIRAEIAKRKS